MFSSSLSYLLLASTVYGRVLPPSKRAVDPATCAKISEDRVKAGLSGIVDCNQISITEGNLQLDPPSASCGLNANDDNERTEAPPDPFVFSTQTDHTIISNDIDGPGKRDLATRVNGRPATDEPEAKGDGKIGTSRLRSNDYQDLCWILEQVYMVDNITPAVGKMGDYRPALPPPDSTPNYMTGGVLAKVWVCDHILELNTIDDFLNQPEDPYAFIRQQLIDPDPENCQLDRIRGRLNSHNNLYGVDRRVNGLKNVLLQGKMPTWSNWEDYAVAGTFLYLEDKTVQAKYLNTAFEVGRALDDFKQPGDTRDVAAKFRQFADSRLAIAAMGAWNQWKQARGDDHVDSRYNTNNLAGPVKAQRTDRTFRSRGMNLPDLDPNDFVVPEPRGPSEVSGRNVLYLDLPIK